MPSDLPQTPGSSHCSPLIDFTKQVSSPRAYSLLTPAHSINGSVSSICLEMSQGEAQSKRKREMDDIGDQKAKKAHIDPNRLRLEDLHLDVGKKYKLCHTPLPPTTPDLRQDLFTLYGLENISKSVARTNPDGSKGVRLRKTYKNHIKDHQLSGNFDSVKRESDDTNTIYGLMNVPQEQWDVEYPPSEVIKDGISESIKHLMGKAFKMSRGTIPRSSWNNSILGDLAPHTVSVELIRPSQTTVKSHQQQNPGNLKATKPGGVRPKRSVKKRTYADSSFEGYGEGYVDDDENIQEADYNSVDGDNISRKRPKKSTQSHNFQSAPTRHKSYGPGMVGA